MIDYRLHKLGVDLAWDTYRTLFVEAFRTYDERQAPTTVLLGLDGDRTVGFVSGYPHDKNTFYVQHIGFTTADLAGRFQVYSGSIAALHQYGYRYVIGLIAAANTKALIWGLQSGFQIVGTRQATSGELYVEVLRDGQAGKTSAAGG